MSEEFVRFFETTCSSNDDRTIEGLAAPYYNGSSNTECKLDSDGTFVERLMPGCWDESIRSNPDVSLCFQHDLEKKCARTPDNLTFSISPKGLHLKAKLNKTSYSNDALELVRTKEARGLSVRFRVPEGGYSMVKEGTKYIKQINKAMLSREVSIVFDPAYKEAKVSTREFEDFKEMELTEIYQERAKKIASEMNT